ncbi:probable ATP-dependent DNA helicase HFM1 [Megalops cyprinoides]|uniref:probable ATP-dependent DNA helicase HFM1 n=1 Tax=Megalops cyprinoides TaxID=118141 RepID=UPI001863F9C5|nr:probable ATP-dependent DNA helicase HFM1 [Megalops cyprinoides]
MLDPEEGTVPLDSLFFDRPVIHKVKPLCQEQGVWQVEPPPSVSEIPATQDLEKEIESFHSLICFNHLQELTCARSSPALKQDQGMKKALVLPLTPQPLNVQGGSGSRILHPVTEIPAQFRSVFKEFPYFNYVQSKALDDILYTSKNFVACAPTGSGKTVLFELAIVRLLMDLAEPWHNVKVVYMAPIKALCSERYENWKQKFGPLGLNCKELTGDTQIDDYFEIQDAHLIMTTPEKWDSMTRKWRDNCLIQLVQLFLIDEVHVVKDTTRGATLEVVVSRMKTMHAYRSMAVHSEPNLSMRFVVVSATIPNISDIADWLSDESGPATCLEMDESHRPVKLRKVVLGFPCSGNQTEFKFDLSLSYKMASIIQTYSEQKPTLVFCSTRKGVQQSASVLAKDARFIMSAEHKQRLMKYANSLLDSKLRDLVTYGVGYHHAGIDVSDRKIIEDAFTLGDLPVLFTTSTLAMGVNLPAHLVVIKSTMHYIGGSCEEYSDTDILQMIGRAGRPQFDTAATAVIMTKSQTKDKYTQLMSGSETIESSLHTHLVEHLNAEIVLHTISDVNVALDWIRSTFLYIRALKNPCHYGFPSDLDRAGIETKLQELCLKNLNALAAIGLITMDEDINFKPTEAGRLMARYCIAFDTMKMFSQVLGTETLPELLRLISRSKEFSDVQLRVSEKRTLNTLNKDKNRITIRYPMEGKIKNNEMKVNCLIQAQLGSIPIQEFSLTQDTGKIFRIGVRISKCLFEYLNQLPKKSFSVLLNSLILAKCFRARLWENSPFISKQLEKIGLSLSTAMVNAGLTTFHKIEQTNARELEMIVNRHPPFGNQIREAVIHLPKYEVSLEQIPRYNVGMAEIIVTVNLKNYKQLLSKRTAPDHHYVTLIIGDCDNNVVFLQKITDSVLLKSGSWSRKIEVTRTPKGEELSVNLISSEFVGLDIQQKYSAFYAGAKRFGAETNSWETVQNTSQRAQGTAQRAQPTPQRAQGMMRKTQGTAERTNPKSSSISSSDKDSKHGMYLDPGKRECNHFCKNKNQCGHDCCKLGVAMVLKRPTNTETGFSSYLRDLKNRNEMLTETPVKRLKMKMCSQAGAMDMHHFSYKPRDTMPALSRYERNQYGHPMSTESVDCFEDFASPQQIPDGGPCYDDRSGYLEDMNNWTEDPEEETPVQTTAGTRNFSVWKQSSTGAKEASNSAPLQRACGYSDKRSVCHTDDSGCFSSDTLNVTFDLGIDDWDDFDDENLVHASEISYHSTPFPSYGSQLSPIVKQVNSSHVVSSAKIRPRASQSLSYIPANRPSEPWHQSEEGPKTCTEMYAEKSPSFPKQTERNSTVLGGKFDFFSKPNTSTHVSETSTRFQGEDSSKEVEVFLGIFDGIF